MASIRAMDSGRRQAVVRRRGLKAVFRTFNTKTDATKWARIMESEIARGVFVDRSEAERTTVGVLIHRYRLEVTPLKKSARNESERLNQLSLTSAGSRWPRFATATLLATRMRT